VIM
jgi:hypothetical protein